MLRSGTYDLPAQPGPSILLVYEGEGSASAGGATVALRRGSVFLVPARSVVRLSSAAELTFFRCAANAAFGSAKL